MRDVLPTLLHWWRSGATVGVATVVATWRSAPRAPGAVMAVGPGGSVVGSVSGGCVEAAVYDLAVEVMRTGRPVLQSYGVSDADATAVGLACGGSLDVFVAPLSSVTLPHLEDLAEAVAQGRPVASVTVIRHDDPTRIGHHLLVEPTRTLGGLGSDRADAAVTDDVRGLLALGQSEVLGYGPEGQRRGEGMQVFAAVYAPHPRMLVFGAIDYAAAVARLGGFVGYAVTVCDARAVFATPARFPEAEVVVDWPHRYLAREAAAGRLDERTVVCVLTHDPKFDVPLLEVALRLPGLAYVGAMGSRRTHQERLARLREAGLTQEEVGRLSSPIGLDLGARTPEETAVSILAEIIGQRWGGAGRPLRELSGPIHRHGVDGPA